MRGTVAQLLLGIAGLTAAALPALAAPHYTVVAWNDLGMHCMDADYSIFAILPPYNTIHAQVIDASGKLLTSAGNLTVTYEAMADPDGSINATSVGKTNFWDYTLALFGVTLAPDTGLAGSAMPGNTPQPMTFETAQNWFTATGIPMTPRDDGGVKNYYPMLKVVVRDASGAVLASTGIVTPVSDEMTCTTCHSSGAATIAKPRAGWVNDPDPERDYRLNILLKHDERQPDPDVYQTVLAKAGYNTAGLYVSVTQDGKPVLCATCHATNALGAKGVDGVPPLTQSMHGFHALKSGPGSDLTLDDINNRDACYSCHPGAQTKCLRGVMGSAVNPDGSSQMQCQSCHGTMSQVGDPSRQGWLNEPSCQGCHTGTATQNGGQIRFTSVFDASGAPRQPANLTFATSDPLYRFSSGHGGLQCEACHGSTHAEFPSADRNDNLQSIALQGYAGVLTECTACHASAPSTTTGGPHGLHPVGSTWVSQHQSIARRDPTPCQTCHGTDYRGTVLSAVMSDRSFSVERSTRTFPKGTVIGCYSCHNGPRGG